MNVFISFTPQALTSLISFLPAAIICPDAIGMVSILTVAILPTWRNDRSRGLVFDSLTLTMLDNREHPSRICYLG